MASILSHPAIPFALRLAGGRKRFSNKLLAAAVACSIFPDIDTLGYAAGVPYGSLLGHRGLTHSIPFAAFLAGIGALFAPRFGTRRSTAFTLLFFAAASHGLLDAMTTGGLGVAFFSPLSNARFFLPWRVIRVSPIGVSAFFSSWGKEVLASEIWYIWVPGLAVGAVGVVVRGSSLKIVGRGGRI